MTFPHATVFVIMLSSTVALPILPPAGMSPHNGMPDQGHHPRGPLCCMNGTVQLCQPGDFQNDKGNFLKEFFLLEKEPTAKMLILFRAGNFSVDAHDTPFNDTFLRIPPPCIDDGAAPIDGDMNASMKPCRNHSRGRSSQTLPRLPIQNQSRNL